MKKIVLVMVIILVVSSSMVWAQGETTDPRATQKAQEAQAAITAKAIRKALAEDPKMKWEYKCIALKNLLNVQSPADLLCSEENLNAKVEKALCALGQKGWELMYVGDQGYIFKKPVK